MDNKAYEGRQSYIEFLKDFGFSDIINDNTNQQSSISHESPYEPKENPTKDELNSITPQFVRSKNNSEVVFNISGQLDQGEKKSDPPQHEDVHLKREMGLWSGVSIIVGTIIGSGIFISPVGIAAGSGSVGFALTNWALCGVISFLGALCVAELATLITKNGGDYMYLKEGLGDLPAYLYAQVTTTIVIPGGIALSSLTCAEYVIIPFFDDACGTTPKILVTLTAVVVIMLLLLINGRSVVLAARIQVIFTIGKVLTLCVIIIGGIVKLAQGSTQYLETGFDGTETNVGKIAVGLYNGMYAYAGWANLNFVAGEMKNPTRNVPLAIVISVPIVTVLYLLVNVSYFSVMSIEDLLNSPAVGITWADRVLGSAAWIISVGVAMSTFGSLNGSFLSSGRVAYSCSREGHTVQVFSMVHVKYFTPLLSIAEMGVIGIILTIAADTSSLLDMFNFVAWTFVGLVMISLLVMRVTKKDVKRAFKVPLPLPILMTLVSFFLVFAPFIEKILVEYLYGIAVLVFFFFLYFPFVYKKYQLPGMDKLTMAVQLFMQVAPPTTKDN